MRGEPEKQIIRQSEVNRRIRTNKKSSNKTKKKKSHHYFFLNPGESGINQDKTRLADS